MFIQINGKDHYLWRAVDQNGNVLDILVQSRRNKKAAKRFFRKLLKGLQYVPRVIITDKLKSYTVQRKLQIMPGARAPSAQGIEQPRRELTSADQSTREGHAQFQVSGASTTVPLRLWHHLITLPTPQTSADGRTLPGRDAVEVCDVERGKLRPDDSLKIAVADSMVNKPALILDCFDKAISFLG